MPRGSRALWSLSRRRSSRPISPIHPHPAPCASDVHQNIAAARQSRATYQMARAGSSQAYNPWPCFDVSSFEREYQRAKRWVRTFPARAYEPAEQMKGSDTTSAPRGCPSEEMRSVVPGSQNSRPPGPSNCYSEPSNPRTAEPSNRRTPLLSGLPPSVFDVQGSPFDIEPRTAARWTVLTTSLVRRKY